MWLFLQRDIFTSRSFQRFERFPSKSYSVKALKCLKGNYRSERFDDGHHQLLGERRGEPEAAGGAETVASVTGLLVGFILDKGVYWE